MVFVFLYYVINSFNLLQVITDKCVICFNIEYSRKLSFFRDKERGFNMVIQLMKQFFIKKFNLQSKNMFFMVLDASNHYKFSRHIILTLFHSNNEEFMYTNNFDSLRKHILEFKQYIINFVFNEHVELSKYDGIDFHGDRKYLRKYVKNVDEREQDIVYDKIANNYFVDDVKEAGIFLEDGKYLNLYNNDL